ncbi:MAG: hypothetical protein LBN06_00670 [Prevotellaceae bacterium]|nr:hypothetical protein [Prevotellaceae bacterium]
MEERNSVTIESFDDVEKNFLKIMKKGIEEAKELAEKNFICRMQTPYMYTEQKTKIDTYSPPAIKNEDNTLDGFMIGLFKHYDVNQSDEDACSKIIDTYVTEGLEKTFPSDKPAVNNEKGVNPDFYNSITDKINRIDTLSAEEQTIYITGMRGCGKTAFFNYFMTTKEKDLNEQYKTITVRINVMKIVDKKCSLIQAIRFKLCRILFLYYYSGSKDVKKERFKNRKIKNDDAIDPIMSDIERIRTIGRKKVVKCSDYFCSIKGQDLMIIPEIYDDICTELLQRIAQKYNFIILIDNFDQLNPNQKSKTHYQERLSEFKNLRADFLSGHCIYLVAIRYGTYKEIDHNGRKDNDIWTIATPTTYALIAKRIEYARKSRKFNNDTDKNIKESKIDYVKKCIALAAESFDKEALSLDSSDNFQQNCNTIDKIYGGNKRIVLNLLTRLLNQIPHRRGLDLREFLTRYEYKVFEALLIKYEGENSDVAVGYCRSFYEYTVDHGLLNFENINVGAHYENSYILNIYKFPAQPFGEMIFMPFLKIRILQILNNVPFLTIDNIANFLSDIFSYRKDAVQLTCTELKDDQSVVIAGGDKYEDTDDNNDRVKYKPMLITSRGDMLLQTLPYSANFLSICLEQTPFPCDYISQMPIGNYFTQRDNVTPGNQSIFYSFFIMQNIHCSLPRFIGMLLHMEKIEKQMYNNYKQRNNIKSDYFYNDSNFALAELLKKSALDSIKKIFESYFDGKEISRESIYRLRKKELAKQFDKIIF